MGGILLGISGLAGFSFACSSFAVVLRCFLWKGLAGIHLCTGGAVERLCSLEADVSPQAPVASPWGPQLASTWAGGSRLSLHSFVLKEDL